MTLKQGLGIKLQKAAVESKRVTTMSRFDLGVKPSTKLWVVDRQDMSTYTQELVFLQFHCLHQTSKACLQLSSWTSRRRIYCCYTMVLLFGIDYYAVKSFQRIWTYTVHCNLLTAMILRRSFSNSKVSTLQTGGIQFQSMVYLTLVYN